MLFEKQQTRMAAGWGWPVIHNYCKIHKDVSKQNYASEVDSSLWSKPQSHTLRKIFKADNMNRSSVVAKTKKCS